MLDPTPSCACALSCSIVENVAVLMGRLALHSADVMASISGTFLFNWARTIVSVRPCIVAILCTCPLPSSTSVPVPPLWLYRSAHLMKSLMLASGSFTWFPAVRTWPCCTWSPLCTSWPPKFQTFCWSPARREFLWGFRFKEPAFHDTAFSPCGGQWSGACICLCLCAVHWPPFRSQLGRSFHAWSWS